MKKFKPNIPIWLTALLLSIPFSSAFGQKVKVKADICDAIPNTTICPELAKAIHKFILTAKPPFNWADENNNCEDRANALCLLLDAWGIPNAKAWCFNGTTAKFEGKDGKMDGYNYHVAVTVLVKDPATGRIDTMVIDPVMDKSKPITIRGWAMALTTKGTNLYFVTTNDRYNHKGVSLTPEWIPNQDQYDSTMKGLTGYNFGTFWTWHKQLKKEKYQKAFEKLKANKPDELKIAC